MVDVIWPLPAGATVQNANKNSQKCYKISNYASFEIEFWVRSYSHIMSSGININMVSNDGSMIDYIQSRS